MMHRPPKGHCKMRPPLLVFTCVKDAGQSMHAKKRTAIIYGSPLVFFSIIRSNMRCSAIRTEPRVDACLTAVRAIPYACRSSWCYRSRRSSWCYRSRRSSWCRWSYWCRWSRRSCIGRGCRIKRGNRDRRNYRSCRIRLCCRISGISGNHVSESLTHLLGITHDRVKRISGHIDHAAHCAKRNSQSGNISDSASTT